MALPKADQCSIMLFVEEGRMFHKIIDHHERFPEESPYLMLSVLPFCAITAHDGVRFVRRHFDPRFSGDTQAVARLRNMSKSLSSKGLTLEEYERQTSAVAGALAASAKGHGGLFGELLNAMTYDVEFVCCGNAPTASTFAIARYLGQADAAGSNLLKSREVTSGLGFDLGRAASVNFYTVDALGIEKASFSSRRFEASAVGAHYSDLLVPLAAKGISNQACLFMLSEMLCQLDALMALRSFDFLSDVLFVKFATAVLLSSSRSVRGMADRVAADPGAHGFTRGGAACLSRLMPKDVRKSIEAASDLRDALVHYDFRALLGEEACRCCDAEELLDAATRKNVGLSSAEYLDWVDGAVAKTAAAIGSFVELPLGGGE